MLNMKKQDALVGKNERAKKDKNKNKCSEIENNLVLNIKVMLDFNLILPLHRSSSVHVFILCLKGQFEIQAVNNLDFLLVYAHNAHFVDTGLIFSSP